MKITDMWAFHLIRVLSHFFHNQAPLIHTFSYSVKFHKDSVSNWCLIRLLVISTEVRSEGSCLGISGSMEFSMEVHCDGFIINKKSSWKIEVWLIILYLKNLRESFWEFFFFLTKLSHEIEDSFFVWLSRNKTIMQRILIKMVRKKVNSLFFRK